MIATIIILFVLSILLGVRSYLSFMKLPMSGIGIVKDSGVSAVGVATSSEIRATGFKGFIQTLRNIDFWILLFKSFFSSIRTDITSLLRRLLFSTLGSLFIFILTLILFIIQCFMWIF